MTDAIAERAAQEVGPKGFGGWLVIPVIGLVLTAAFSLYSLAESLFQLLEPRVWQALFAKPSLLHLLLGFDFSSSVVLLILALVGLARMKRRSHRFPSLMIIFLCTNFVVHVVEAVLTLLYFDSVDVSPPSGAGRGSFGALLGVLIWVPYFIRSKRVKNTFTA
jgi:hypothetical protein